VFDADSNHAADVGRLLTRMREEGVPLPAETIVAVVEEPNWEATRTRHDWRSHVPGTVRAAWDSLPLAARLCIFETAELAALEEEGGTPMVTGPADSL
jgi:hypothetical protein